MLANNIKTIYRFEIRFRMEKRGLLAMANSGKDSNNS